MSRSLIANSESSCRRLPGVGPAVTITPNNEMIIVGGNAVHLAKLTETRERIEGYTSVRALPSNSNELVDLFIRLRVIYVYLSRLHLWSEHRTPEQERDLSLFKTQVHAKTGWNVSR